MWGGLGKHTDLFTCIQTQVIRLLFGSANLDLCVDEWRGGGGGGGRELVKLCTCACISKDVDKGGGGLKPPSF